MNSILLLSLRGVMWETPLFQQKWWSHTLGGPVENRAYIIMIVGAAKRWSPRLEIHCRTNRNRTWVRRGSPLSTLRLRTKGQVKGKYIQRKKPLIQLPSQWEISKYIDSLHTVHEHAVSWQLDLKLSPKTTKTLNDVPWQTILTAGIIALIILLNVSHLIRGSK